MSGSRRYVLDANVFIEAKNKYYGFNLCPGYWKALIEQHKKGCVFSIDKVRDELIKVHNELDDERDLLSDWAKETVPDTFFKKTQDQDVIDAFQGMVTWVNSETQFSPAAKAEFARVADGWMIAFAKVNKLVVVTHEVYAADAVKKVPIPNVCHKFNVKDINTFEMLEDLKVKFVMSTKR